MNNKRKVIIIGTGVLGAYLSKIYLTFGYKVYVTSRYEKKKYKNYKYLKIQKKVNFLKLDILNKKDIKKKIQLINPKIIYYFAGQSSIINSYSKAKETISSNYYGAVNFLKVLETNKLDIKFFKANSGYIFKIFKQGVKPKLKFQEPTNPYIKSQIDAFKAVKEYRKKGINCYSLIFLNIESPLKLNNFLLNKVCNFVKNKKLKFLKVGNIYSKRDFSWAPEIMKGVFYASNLKPQDIVFGSGKNFLVKDMINYVLQLNKTDFKKTIKVDKTLYRKKERKNISISIAKTINLLKKWKWRPKIYGKKLVRKLYYSN